MSEVTTSQAEPPWVPDAVEMLLRRAAAELTGGVSRFEMDRLDILAQLGAFHLPEIR